MKSYIYILPFLNGKYFKIGISNNSLRRIKEHNSTYGIDKDKVLVFEGEKRVIKALESSLLSICPEINIFKDKDGHTEIRDIKHLEYCMDFIKFYESKNEITRKEIDFTPVIKEPTKNKYSKRTIKEPSTTLTEEELNKFIDSIILFISDKKIECLIEGAYYKVLFNLSTDENRYDFKNKYQLFFDCNGKNIIMYFRMGITRFTYCSKTTEAEAVFFINPFSSIEESQNKHGIDFSFCKEPYERLNTAFLNACK
ncbi:hypothetical protein G1L02_06915 [Tenacibaculum finnmarkense]|uniref:GIY-YIG nuclease family protein n=1 Tax=Tenacibaculum finnmarkense TaxID=2781243 RepID=UPI001EFACA42|nr:GIY-YIG nuclease family protein [Tenacibaculum finnmarkense]MCG8882890.1 hypothetical protein [Tenacibaculum finnmarkense]